MQGKIMELTLLRLKSINLCLPGQFNFEVGSRQKAVGKAIFANCQLKVCGMINLTCQ
jgi:hypothetical protein